MTENTFHETILYLTTQLTQCLHNFRYWKTFFSICEILKQKKIKHDLTSRNVNSAFRVKLTNENQNQKQSLCLVSLCKVSVWQGSHCSVKFTLIWWCLINLGFLQSNMLTSSSFTSLAGHFLSQSPAPPELMKTDLSRDARSEQPATLAAW